MDLGAGWNSIDHFFPRFGIREKNLFGTGKALGFESEIGKFNHSFSIDYSEQWLLNKPIPVHISLFDERRGEHNTGYREESRGIRLNLGQWLSLQDQYFLHALSFRVEKSKLSNFSQEIQASNPNGIATARWPVTTSSIAYLITSSSLDRLEFPKSGLRFSFSNELAGGVSDKPVKFHKHELQLEWYQMLLNLFTLKSNFKAGVIDGIGGNARIPYFDRFFVGGGDAELFVFSSTNLRGYDNQLTNASHDRTGGKAMMKYGLELRLPIILNPIIYLLTFAEAGEKWVEFNDVHLGDLRKSVGFGTRIVKWYMVIGFDYAYGFDHVDFVTGKTVGKWKRHFVLGMAL